MNHITLTDLIEHCQDGMPPQSFLMEHNVTVKQLRDDEERALRGTPKHLWDEVITLEAHGFKTVTGTVRELMTRAQLVSDQDSADYAECGAYCDDGGFDAEWSWVIAAMSVDEMFTHTCERPVYGCAVPEGYYELHNELPF